MYSSMPQLLSSYLIDLLVVLPSFLRYNVLPWQTVSNLIIVEVGDAEAVLAHGGSTVKISPVQGAG